ncbi:sigma-70 family RNA polymerase sigma factor [Yinghuangia sp. ASG 101]|uniref:sigma-70 family RNA polymerase sigma factor n=1 Tax=Yinghuangia sp. ASG 101 TaxID=2896848 RepID=UPI001E2BA96D|nr:sigma-70 family RNA polymerase sigma factor [Yinghuangia sp. ASG 101]UGQ11567.1 sigma-70 family RNA polymerase sigma factor [Yinghuangia sp. ASG 101]
MNTLTPHPRQVTTSPPGAPAVSAAAAPPSSPAEKVSLPSPRATAPLSPVGRGERDTGTTPPDPADVTACALAAGAGLPGAAEAFVAATYRDVWRFLAHLADVRNADDLTQETYLRVWTALPRFTAASSARTWLFSIARRVVADRYRAAAARPRTVSVDDCADLAERGRNTALPEFDEGIALADLCRTLEPARREAFVLTQVIGLDYAATARILDCPIGTVRSRVARARGDLITALHAAESSGGR